jgi:hypothetical protein
MKDVTLVVYQDDYEVFVTTEANEANFVQEFFGQPDSERKLEDFERQEATNLVGIALEEN